MPTGYTADVETGKVTDFRTFALQCARAFGACIMQRDDPMADPPKPREASPYYSEALARAKGDIVRLAGMSDEQAEIEAEADYQRQLAAYTETVERNRVENARYAAMMEQVLAWTPPTVEHVAMKDFMAQQITASLHDYTPTKPTRLSGPAWLAEAKNKAERDEVYHTKHLAEDNERVNGANEWIRQLYESLDQIPV